MLYLLIIVIDFDLYECQCNVLFSIFVFLRPGIIYTFQALSEEDRKLWMDVMDGKEPVFKYIYIKKIVLALYHIFKRVR